MKRNGYLPGSSRIKIFMGEFGSGKTELAVNYSINLARRGLKTAIVDIDLVKPYFRTRENRVVLEDQGVIVVAPEQKLAHSDLPIMPINLTRVLYDNSCNVVMDVGGGDSAIVLGQINCQLAENGYEAMLVVNTLRPFTNSAAGIIEMLRRIEQVSRLKINGLVCNANLAQETTQDHILKGLKVVEEASAISSIPIKMVVVPNWLEDTVVVNYPIFILKPYTQYPWIG